MRAFVVDMKDVRVADAAVDFTGADAVAGGEALDFLQVGEALAADEGDTVGGDLVRAEEQQVYCTFSCSLNRPSNSAVER